MRKQREKFSSQVEPELLAELRELARQEGRQLQAVLEDALREYLENRKQQKPSATVMAHFRASVEKNRRLGKLLAQCSMTA